MNREPKVMNRIILVAALVAFYAASTTIAAMNAKAVRMEEIAK